MAELEENKALVRHYFEDIEAGNIDVIDEVLSETFTTGTDVVRSNIETSGRETLKAAWREFLEAFPDIERAVLTEGTETPLEHSSGVRLWLTKWAVDAIRGELTVESTDSGTRAIVSVPSLHSETDSV